MFIDIKKAYDVAWYDAALLRLHRLGIDPATWHLIDDIGSGCSSCVRLAEGMSATWGVEGGLAQGRVLSPLLFNIVVNGVAAAVRRVNPGVRLGPEPHAPAVPILLYADDIVILASSPETHQTSSFFCLSSWPLRSQLPP